MQDFTNYSPGAKQGVAAKAVSSEALFFQRIYMWMCGGLGLTALIAYGLAQSSGWVQLIIGNQMILWMILIAELAVVFILSSKINTMAPSTAKGMFILYAALNGLTFSVVAIASVYYGDAVIKAFVCTVGIYGAMAAYGLMTKRSLQGLGSFLFMGLVGLILASIVNIFWQNGAMDFIICCGGVLIFAGLTAFDHQKLRVIYFSGFEDGAAESRMVVYGALTLYLDFINLFLFLLRLFAANRD